MNHRLAIILMNENQIGKLLDLSSQVCQTLWCKLPDNRCVTRLEPAAPGTSCAKHKVGKKQIFSKTVNRLL